MSCAMDNEIFAPLNEVHAAVSGRRLLETIGDITREKKEARIVPSHALGVELRNRTGLTDEQIASVIKVLAEEGLVDTGRTINDYYIRLQDE